MIWYKSGNFNPVYFSMKHFILQLTIVLLSFCPPVTGQQVKQHDYTSLSREIFRELIEINTTASKGSSVAAEAMAKRLKNGGFADNEINLVGPEQNHLNMIVRLRGKGTKPPVLFISHLDVVEALPQDWSFDPFIFRESDGFFYGRGTTDIKNEDADLVLNLIRLKQEGYIPERDIILALTENEEGGDFNGIKWLLANRRDLING